MLTLLPAQLLKALAEEPTSLAMTCEAAGFLRGAGQLRARAPGVAQKRIASSTAPKPRHDMAFFPFTDSKIKNHRNSPRGAPRGLPLARGRLAPPLQGAAAVACGREPRSPPPGWKARKTNRKPSFFAWMCCLIHETSLAPRCGLTHDECHQDCGGPVLAPTPDTWEVRSSSPLQETLRPAIWHPLPKHLWRGEDEEAAKKGAHPMSAHDPPEGNCRQCFEPQGGFEVPRPA